MSEERETTPECSDSVLQQIQQILAQNPSLTDKSAKELETVLTSLAGLPFTGEVQQTSFFELVKRLQGYHIIHIFNFGVAPLQKSLAKSSAELLEEARQLLKICLSFCYTPDVLKRVSFDYYLKALKFCFTSDPKQCLSTAALSKLLELVQICWEGEFAEPVCEKTTQEAKPSFTIKAPDHFFAELLQTLKARWNVDCLEGLIEETVRFASADAKIKCVQRHKNGEKTFKSEHVVSPVFLTSWLKLLKMKDISNGFALCLAKADSLIPGTKDIITLYLEFVLGSQTSVTYQSTVCTFVRVLDEMQRNGIEIGLPHDQERLNIFFNHLNHFCDHPTLVPTSLKLLATTGISSEFVKEILQQFVCNKKTYYFGTKDAFESVVNVLSVFPDGEVVKRTLTFWREAFCDDHDYQMLECLLALLDVEGSSNKRVDSQEKAKRTLDFVESLPRHILPLSLQQGLLSLFIKIFPTSFQRGQEELVLIHRAVQAAPMPTRQHLFFEVCEQHSPLQLLQWLSQQNCTEELKSEMIGLLHLYTTDEAVSPDWMFLTGVIKGVGLCPRLTFDAKRQVVHKLNSLAPFVNDPEKMVLKQFIEKVASDETLECMEEIFFEFLDFVKHCVDKQSPTTVSDNVLDLISLLSRVSISGERRVKVLKLSKKSGEDLLNGLRIMQIIERHQYALKERQNEYFDHLFTAIIVTLKGDNRLCEQLYNQNRLGSFPSADVVEVWTTSVTELVSSGLFIEEVDALCCSPILQQARGFTSESEISQLLSKVRSTAERVVQLSTQSRQEPFSPGYFQHTSQESSTSENAIAENFVDFVTPILSTDMFSSCEKLLLVEKACDVVLSTPDILTKTKTTNALTNLISYNSWQSTESSRNEDALVAFKCITTVLENPTVLVQLSRIPEDPNHNFLCDILSRKISKSFCIDNFVDVFIFIGSLHDLDQRFFDHLLPFLEDAIQKSMTVEDLLEILKELGQILRRVPPEMIPITMFNFSYLLQNPVDILDRDTFLTEVAVRLKLSPNYEVLSFLEVPRLIWKAYNTSSTLETSYEMMNRLQQIVTKSSTVEDWIKRDFRYFGSFVQCENFIRRRIACCELEWLVFHSSLSTEDAALALDMSCLSFQRFFWHTLKCFSFSDVHISEDGIFKFVPKENTPASKENVPGKDTGSASGVAVASTGNLLPASDSEAQKPILTPIVVAKEVIYHLKRLLGPDKEPSEISLSLWDQVFNSNKLLRWCEAEECLSNCPALDDYVEVFLSVLAEASSIEIMYHWARLDKLGQHHFCQCSDVILEACKWKRSNEECISKDALLNLQTTVSTTLHELRMKTCRERVSLGPIMLIHPEGCFRLLKSQIELLRQILERRLPIEATIKLLHLFQINVQAGIAIGEIVSTWSCEQQSSTLIETIHQRFKSEGISSFGLAKNEFVWQLLKTFGWLCMNSCDGLLAKLNELVTFYDPEDDHGLNRLPKWRATMVEDGFPARAIDSWCAAFLITPPDGPTSRDVDAIVDLNSRSLRLVSPVSEIITGVIFPRDGFQVTEAKGVKQRSIKELIRLARFLGELIGILKARKPEENRKDAAVRDVVVKACQELCESHEKNRRKQKHLRRIVDDKLKDVFTEVFGKRSKSEDGQVSIGDCGITHQAGKQELRPAIPVARQSSYLHENLQAVLSDKHIYEPMTVLLRRWLSGISTRPTLGSYTLEIVQLLFSVHPGPLKESHDIIQSRILSFERNQPLIAQLQAAGYNQRKEGIPDLWSSQAVELPCYLTRRECPNSKLLKKKLKEVLRPLWNEFKDILFAFCIHSINVGDDEVCTKDLFRVQASLEEMEKQADAVKEVFKQINLQDTPADRRLKELIRLEQQKRTELKERYEINKSSDGTSREENDKSSDPDLVEKDEMKKFVAVWENRFLEQIQLCSERIPGCYAPNGFHSEKPVLCALSVDNKILTIFKEDKSGRREEIENVEVKLFEAGMYVYGLHTSGHDYVTDELWAAFYKMLLEGGLVPSIVLSNESPGFDWILKTLTQPATSLPHPWKWVLHQGIVPKEEDYFDHLPLNEVFWPENGSREFITLTSESVSSFKFSDFKEASVVEERERQIDEIFKKAIQALQHELHVLHGDNQALRKVLAGKLKRAVKEIVKGMVDGMQHTEETVKDLIDVENLAYGHPEVEETEESQQQYAAAVLRACEHAR